MNHYRIRIFTRGLTTLLFLALALSASVAAWRTAMDYEDVSGKMFLLLLLGFTIVVSFKLATVAVGATRSAYRRNRMILIGQRRLVSKRLRASYNPAGLLAGLAVMTIGTVLAWQMFFFMRDEIGDPHGIAPNVLYYICLSMCVVLFFGSIFGMIFVILRKTGHVMMHSFEKVIR